ncbi:hypothetical protein F5Y14DRAFT_466304 [Nemania sp. NC0429]|nr:hypothetical protein F5Y14DRAFT_466304 [Nemania sp. NC0429]
MGAYYLHPDVKTLKAIADARWTEPDLRSRRSPRTDTPHDALAITRLVANSCWAVQNPYSTRVKEFIVWFGGTRGLRAGQMSRGELEEKLGQLLHHVDDLFFFSLLSRQVVTESGRRIPLAGLRVVDRLGEDMLGLYVWPTKSDNIRVARKLGAGVPNPTFEDMMVTVVHESCHAYLTLFSDPRHRRHKAWILDFGNHGEMFWVLYRFVSEKILHFTNSSRWRRELLNADDCEDMTKTRGKAGDWGTPERHLMGGVLYNH